MVTSRTCGEPGRGRVAWQPGKPPVHVADRTLGAQSNSSTRTDHRNTRSPLEGVRETAAGVQHSGSLYELMFGVSIRIYFVKVHRNGYIMIHTHTYQGRCRRSWPACGRW